MQLIFTYAILALIATVANIGTQDLVIRSYNGCFNVTLSILSGTATGMIVKYALDKRYIFDFQADSKAHDVRIFALYSLMGVATTLIFWAFELGFDRYFATREMRYFGALLGLAIGYMVKYRLDKHFVFRTEPL
jgi:putative flippase GtrA